MATANRTAPKKASSRKSSPKPRRKAARKPPDLHAVLYQLNTAVAIVTVALISIERLEPGEPVDQEVRALRAGVAALNAVCDELDRADVQLSVFLKCAGKAVRS